MARTSLIVTLLLSSGCSGQQFSGSAKSKEVRAKDAAVEQSPRSDSSEQTETETEVESETIISTPPVIVPVPIAGAYLTCSFTDAVAMLCKANGLGTEPLSKIYSISGVEAKWTALKFSITLAGDYSLQSVPESAYALAFVKGDGSKHYVNIPERIQAKQNLIVDASFEENLSTNESNYEYFSTESNTAWSFEGSTCSASGGFMDLAVMRTSPQFEAFRGSQWASLDNSCRIGTARSSLQASLYQSHSLKSTHAYLLRLVYRTRSAGAPQSTLEVQYARSSLFVANVSNTSWKQVDLVFAGDDLSSLLSFTNKDLSNPVDIDDLWLVDLGAP